MVYREATYEEYKKASQFAKLRYKVGVFVQIIAVILFCFLLYYTITNIEEMKANPSEYAEEKLGVICSYPVMDNYFTIDYGSIGNITGIEQG